MVCRHVLFGFSPDEVRSIPRIFVYMLNVCRFSIWKVRNDFRFRDVPPGAFVVIEMVKSRVRFFLPLLFKRFKSPRRRRFFHRQWGASGVIGLWLIVVFSCPPSDLFLFPFACCCFSPSCFLCWCCAFIACPALLTANQRLCWISRLTGDLFLVCHLLLRWIVFPVFLLL